MYMYVCLHYILVTRYANTFGTGTESLDALFLGPDSTIKKELLAQDPSGDYIIERKQMLIISISISLFIHFSFSSLTRMHV